MRVWICVSLVFALSVVGCSHSAVPVLTPAELTAPRLDGLTPRSLALVVSDLRPVSPEDRSATEAHLVQTFAAVFARQHIDAFVVRVAVMALDPLPFDPVPAGGGMQALPQVAVLHRIAARRPPAAAHPARHPFGDALAHVLRIDVQRHPATFRQHFQCGDGRHQQKLH